jgi:hypothetical protein
MALVDLAGCATTKVIGRSLHRPPQSAIWFQPDMTLASAAEALALSKEARKGVVGHRVFDKFLVWCSLWSWHIACALLVLVGYAVYIAFDEHRFFPAFFEVLAALLLYVAIVLGGIILAIFVGIEVARRTSHSWAGWIVGILVIAVSMYASIRAEKIPGVGPRFFNMLESSPDD